MDKELISAEKVSQNGCFEAEEGCRMMRLIWILKKQTENCIVN